MKHPCRLATTICLLAGAVWLTSCGGDSPEALIAAARVHLDGGQPRTAAIELKNALQGNPTSGEARFLLGRALLEADDPVGAAVELRKADELKYPHDQVAPALARALLRQGDAKRVVELFEATTLTNPAATADLKTSLAKAYSALGRRDQSEAALNAALVAVPSYPPALLYKARTLAESDMSAATRIVDDVLRTSPEDADAWMTKGDLSWQQGGDPATAVAAYKKVIAIRPNDLPSRWALLGVYASRDEVEAESAGLEELRRLSPDHPRTRYLEAAIALRRGDLKGARDAIQPLLKAGAENAQVMQLAGIIELRSGAPLQAEEHLNKALQLSPDSTAARIALAQAYLQFEGTAKALKVLAPALAQKDPPSSVLSIAGLAHLQNGEVRQAEEYFRRALAANPGDTQSRTALAVAHLYGANSGAALAELETIAKSQPGTAADLAVIDAHLRRKELDAALSALDALEKKMPGRAMPFNLRGLALQAAGNLDAARKSFQRAIEIDPTYIAAVEHLAALDLQANRPADAEKRFDAVLSVRPDNVRALTGLAQLKALTGKDDDRVVDLLSRAVKAAPSSVMPRLMLIDHHLRHKNPTLALSAAQEAAATTPDNPLIIDAMARSQIASREFDQAIRSFAKLATLRPDSPQGPMGAAEAYVALGNLDAAKQELKRALAIAPNYVDAQQKLIALELGAGNRPAAMKIARSLQEQHPKLAAGYLYEGNIQALAKEWAAATVAYRKALRLSPTTDIAEKLHVSLRATGKTSDAERFSNEWLKEHPQDAAFKYYLGNSAMLDLKFAVARDHFLSVVKMKPDFAPAFNNLAWTMSKLGDPNALKYIERANELRPNEPAFLDTWAMILAGKNDLDKAIKLQRKAVELQPNNPAFRLSLARLFVKTGDRSSARRELNQLAENAEKSGLLKEIQQLRAQL